MWVWEKMVPKCEVHENIPLHIQGLNYKASLCELKDHVGEKGVKLKLADKTWACKKHSSCKFSQSFVRKHLSQICISLCPIAPPQGGKMRHHWGSRRIKCQVTTLYGSCTSLSNGK
jgi:hypothetical protein